LIGSGPIHLLDQGPVPFITFFATLNIRSEDSQFSQSQVTDGTAQPSIGGLSLTEMQP